MRKVLSFITVAAALTAFAGDDLKVTKSKPIVYYPPTTPLSEFGVNLVSVADSYILAWDPMFNDNIYGIGVNWNSWELQATYVNSRVKYVKMDEEKRQKEFEHFHYYSQEYLMFTVCIRSQNDEFYTSSARGYWNFRLYSEKGEIERAGEIDRGDLSVWFKDVPFWNVYVTDKKANTYHLYFRNPYTEETPEFLRLVVEGGDIKRGFEWRFKQDKP